MSEYPNYLIHYGTQGQKWGVRRYQNEDGTYTQEGLERRRKFFNVEKGERALARYGKGTGDYRVARRNAIKSAVVKVGAAGLGAGLTTAALGISVATLDLPAAAAVIAYGAAQVATQAAMAYSTVKQIETMGDVASLNMYDKVKRRENPDYNKHNDMIYKKNGKKYSRYSK